MKVAVILVSGGMDSCVTVASSISDGYCPALLHMNYGQKTEKRELTAFYDIANHYEIKERLVVDISHLSDIGGSCLTDSQIDVPEADLNNPDIPVSYVPFRNANILSAATSWAEILKASAIYVGAVEEDSSGYPDCRRSFFDAFETVIDIGTKLKTNIKIATPLISLTKKEIIEKGINLNAPLHLTWSCYKNEMTISGSGPTVFAITNSQKTAGKIESAMVRAFNSKGVKCNSLITTSSVDGSGIVKSGIIS